MGRSVASGERSRGRGLHAAARITPRLIARDAATAVLLSAFLAALGGSLLRSASGVTIILVAHGILGGVLIILPRSRWPTYIVVAFLAQILYYQAVLQLTLPVSLVRTAADCVALVGYAWIVTQYRQPKSGLGADFLLVLAASVGGAIIRALPVVVLNMPGSGSNTTTSGSVGLEVFFATVIGFMVGSAIVIGLSRWRETRPWRGWGFILDLALVALIALATVLVWLTPVGANVPGSRYFYVALMLLGATRLSVPYIAVVNGLAVIGVATAAAKGLGAFEREGLATTSEVLSTQAYLLTVTVSVFILSATIDQRRSVERAYRKSAQTLQGLFDASPFASAWVRVGDTGRIAVWQANPAFATLVGVPDGTLDGAFLDEFLTASGHGLLAQDITGADLWCTVAGRGGAWLRPTLSHFVPAEVEDPPDAGVGPLDPQPLWRLDPRELQYSILILEDVTASRTFEEVMRRQTQRDPLTGLPNRAVLVERLDRRARDGHRPGVAVTVINIDGLRDINDHLGFGAGDQVLMEAAARIRAAAGGDGFVGHLGGDEFIVIDDLAGGLEYDAAAVRLLDVISEPMIVAGRSIVVTASVGVASSESPLETEMEVLRRADLALAEVKTGGRNRIGRAPGADGEKVTGRFDVESRLRVALEQHELVIEFQPLVNLASGEVVSAEALTRLRDDSGGLIPPGLFIPLAEDVGLLNILTEQVVERACEVAAGWWPDGPSLSVAVNAAPSWLTPTATDFVLEQLSRHDLPGEALTLEITEDEMIDLGGEQLRVLADLKQHGVVLAIDDFGTGYSGLSSFLSVPSDLVKIDRSFVATMLNSEEDTDMVRSIIDLLHRFGRRTVAEGIENADQYEALKAMGCDFGQGFHIGRPGPVENLRTEPYESDDVGVPEQRENPGIPEPAREDAASAQ